MAEEYIKNFGKGIIMCLVDFKLGISEASSRIYVRLSQAKVLKTLTNITFPCSMKVDEKSDIEVRAISNPGGANIAISLHSWYERVGG